MKKASVIITFGKDDIDYVCHKAGLNPNKKLFRTFKEHPTISMSLSEFEDICGNEDFGATGTELLCIACVKSGVSQLTPKTEIKLYDKHGEEFVVRVNKDATSETIANAINQIYSERDED